MSGTATAPLLPYEPEDPSSARNPQRLWVFILVGVLVLAAVAGFGANRYLSSQDDPNHPVSAGQAKTPAAAVRAYLQALAAGNANDALSFAVTPADTTFLTKEVLMASLALNPITEIATALDTSAPRSSSSATVNAFYKIGLLPVNTTFAVS
ncbi:MAG: hypothetical protein FWD80_01415, partial [Propionibacteriaceae bacterium]|nr:hypothetical protein [Propionibacteriaceae bacterium]